MRHQTYEHHQMAPEIAPDLIGSIDEARDIVRGLLPAAGHDEAEGY